MLAEGVDRETNLKMIAARCIVAVVVNPEIKFTVDAIARATGLARTEVQEAVTSEEWRSMLDENLKERCKMLLARGLDRMEEIMLRSGSEVNQMAAFRAVTTLQRTLTLTLDSHDNAAGESKALEMLNELRRAQQPTKVPFKEIDADDTNGSG